MAFKSYRDLEIYKKSHQLAVEIHKKSLDLPKFEMYEAGSQIRRSSKSVKTNIVEGFGRRKYKQEFVKFLIYSLSSCDETLDHIETLFDTGSLQDEKAYNYFQAEYNCLGKMISKFIRSVELNHKT